MGGIPYLEKDDDVKAKWTINNTVEMRWEGKRFGVPLCVKRIYHKLRDWDEEQLCNVFFEEVNHHIKEFTETFFLSRSNYVIPPERFKPDLATLNEILTKQGLHHLDRLLTNGGGYEIPQIYKYCDNTDCINGIIKHETAVSVEPIRDSDGCSD